MTTVALPLSDAATCCADFYQQDWVRALLGDSFHPGGLDLSERLIESLELHPGARVLDLACGTGTSAVWLARHFDVKVVGLDAGEQNLSHARKTATAAGVSELVRFVQADARSIPFDDDAFDAVICECAVSTFSDKGAVLGEVARVLRPTGIFGMSDMARYADLPAEMEILVSPWACLADALTHSGYEGALRERGFANIEHSDESQALVQMQLMLKKKLLAAALGQAAGALDEMPMSLPKALELLGDAKALVTRGDVRYVRVAARTQARDASLATVSARRAAPLEPPFSGCKPSSGCC